ncbi:hypothetical protein F5882DRAFT_423371 [Hyaloscypha sp. PMI_1271]|nr:hypothetical protein F5882DRAFT_423371 [Hyaloscypha sp. PMI_1271]
MGEIYRQARQVLVWLGRPGSQLGSRVADAVKLLESLGNFPPQSTLPSQPPEPDTLHEAHFEQWIRDLSRSNESEQKSPKEKQPEVKSSWFTRFKMKTYGALRQHRTSAPEREVEYPPADMEIVRKLPRQGDSSTNRKPRVWKAKDQWKEMKEDRDHRQRRRQRIPEMVNELKEPEPLLAEKLQELKDLQALKSRQQKDLEALQLLEKQELRKLDDPLRRVLLQFKARQIKALAEARSLWQDEAQENQKPDDAGLQEQQDEKKQQDLGDQGELSCEDPQEVESIRGQISGNLGKLQRYIEDRRQELKEEEKWSRRNPAEWKQLEKLQLLELDERQELRKLENQLAGWLRLENNQREAFQHLAASHDGEFKSRMKTWDQDIQDALEGFGSRRDFEPDQFEELHHRTRHQLKALENLGARHESQCAESLTFEPEVEPSLTADELEILRQLKVQRRRVHRQLLVLRHTEIQCQAITGLLEKYAKWTEHVYKIRREMPTVEDDERKTRQDLLDAQAAWVREWRGLSTMEWEKWQDRVFLPLHTKYKSWDILLLSLTDVCDLAYWSRLWIVQEVLLAKDLVLCFGDDARTSKSWNVLTKARHTLSQIPIFWPCDPDIGERLEMIRYSLPFQLDRLRDRSGRGWPLHSLLEITENSLCREPRDKVYGLLGLANDCEVGDIDISYSKPIEDVYQDMVCWYHNAHGSQESSPSLVRFSQTIQLSFKAHSQIEADCDSSGPFHLAQPLSTETFSMEAILKGSILPIEKHLQDGQLIGLCKQDWVSVLLDYLVPNNQFPERRAAIERELISLDSITTTFALPTSSPVSATDRTLSFGSEDRYAHQKLASKPQGKRDEHNFFVTADGEFGVASTRIREGDRLCRFKDSQFSLILRRSGSDYVVVSKAILSHAVTDVLNRSLPHRRAPHGLTMPLMEDAQPAPQEEAALSEFPVIFDVATLQQLTMPLELSAKHTFREPACIHKADFGWYEFITFGLDVSPSGVALGLEPNLFTVEASNGIKRKDETSVRDTRRKVRVGNVSGEGLCATYPRQREEDGLGVDLELGNFWKLERPMLIWAH